MRLLLDSKTGKPVLFQDRLYKNPGVPDVAEKAIDTLFLQRAKELNIPLIRSPRDGKSFQPFGVQVIFQEYRPELNAIGSFSVSLPRISMDIGEMDWRIALPQGFFILKGEGDFQIAKSGTHYEVGEISQRSNEEIQSYSNVAQTQSNINEMPTIVPDTGGVAQGGVLPVVVRVPETGNSRLFNKKLIAADGSAPRMQLYFVKEKAFLKLLFLFALFIAILVAHTLRAFLQRRWQNGGIILGFLITLGASIGAAYSLLGRYLPFLDEVLANYIMGIPIGIILVMMWIILQGPKKLPTV